MILWIGDGVETTFVVFGGIGLFLLGLVIMTDGLKSIAGNALKQLLSRFTGGTFSAILSGTGITAIIQSSSAASLMTIGFVSAGLLTFSQSVGVIIGANLGSTSIGWIVSVIGFKVSMGTLAMPFVGVGALLRFFSKGKYAPHGMALAGIGLLFLGIDILQNGMSALAPHFSLQALGDPNILQKLLLILIGIVMTVLMQSSGTALVVTLSAIAAGTVTIEQAAVLVIGQNVGTTVKAYVASIGGTVPARRTAMTHVWFNLFTGLIAFILLPWLLPAIIYFGNRIGVSDSAILLTILNTTMYIVGIIVIVPLLKYFIKFIAFLVPDRSDSLTKHLDPSVADVPAVAIEAGRRTLVKVTKLISGTAAAIISEEAYTPDKRNQLEQAELALSETRQFLSLINQSSSSSVGKDYTKQVALIHIIDHLERLQRALTDDGVIHYLTNHTQMQEALEQMQHLFLQVEQDLSYGEVGSLLKDAEHHSVMIADLRRKNRKDIFESTVKQQANIDEALQDVHILHWVDSLAYHMWRALLYFDVCQKEQTDVDPSNLIEQAQTMGESTTGSL